MVEAGGTASNTIVSGGDEVVSAGGTDDGARVSGGTQLDYGLASGGTVFAGLQVIEAGRTADQLQGRAARQGEAARGAARLQDFRTARFDDRAAG